MLGFFKKKGEQPEEEQRVEGGLWQVQQQQPFAVLRHPALEFDDAVRPGPPL